MIASQQIEPTQRHPIGLPPVLGGPPEFLSSQAREEWDRTIQQFGATGFLLDVDRSMLAAYCCSYALWIEAQAIVRQEGMLIRQPILNSRGELRGHRVVRHPAVLIARDQLNLMHSFGALFGLSPGHRDRIRRRR